MKLAFHIAKWVDKGDGELSQAEFIAKYFDTANEIKVVSKRNENEKTVLSSNMVRGKIRPSVEKTHFGKQYSRP